MGNSFHLMTRRTVNFIYLYEQRGKWIWPDVDSGTSQTWTQMWKLQYPQKLLPGTFCESPSTSRWNECDEKWHHSHNIATLLHMTTILVYQQIHVGACTGKSETMQHTFHIIITHIQYIAILQHKSISGISLRFGIFLQNHKGFIMRAPTCIVQYCSQVLFIVGSIPPAGIETLPQELQRNFTLMRDLDQWAEGTYSTPTHKCGHLAEAQSGVSTIHFANMLIGDA